MKHNSTTITPTLIKEFNKRFYLDSDYKLRAKTEYHYTVKIDDEAGSTHSQGYRRVTINQKSFLVHRIIFAMTHNRAPTKDLDHKDHNKLNNHPSNLREVSNETNARNRPKYKNNSTGITGVYRIKYSTKWKAAIKVNNKSIHLGTFSKMEQAISRRKAAEVAFGFYE